MKNVTPGQQKPNAQVNVDLDKLPDIFCLSCGGREFIQITHLKRMTKLLSPNGQEGIINANMLRCENPECKKVFDVNEYQKWERDKEQAELEKAVKAQEALKVDDSADPDTTMCRNCGTVHQINTDCPECSGTVKGE